MQLPRRSAFELFLVATVVVLSVALGIGLYRGRLRVHNDSLLLKELSMLRSAITHYKLVHRQNPPTLSQLLDQTYDAGDGVLRPFLERLPGDGSTDAVDPFGNPYRYEPKTGWVSSTTEGYGQW